MEQNMRAHSNEHSEEHVGLAWLADRLLENEEPFGIAIFPHETQRHLFGANVPVRGKLSMEIIPWLGTFADRIVIGQGAFSNNCINACLTQFPKPTAQDDYLRGVRKVIDSCRNRNGKTVFSRVISGKLRCGTFSADTLLSAGEVAEALFGKYPDTFRFMFCTPATGAWLGATPELLLDFDRTTGRFSTMSFAGTRPRGEGREWDCKNIKENRFVTDYISEALRRLGIEPVIAPPRNVAFGNIEHLCIDITGQTDPDSHGAIIDALNPTPALCGWPKEDAIKDIDLFESHRRGCYGGVVAISSPTRYRAFVNLRSMRFVDGDCAIFGGGGITPLSIPEEEFAETEAKTAVLQSLTGASPNQ